MNNIFYSFFYDESGHSRKITKETINAGNYTEDFIAFIVGVKNDELVNTEQEYLSIEEKYKKYYQVDELKSTIFSQKKYQNGFASFKPKDIEFFNELFDFVLKHELLLYCFVSNKIEWIIVQFLEDYFKNPIYNSVSIEYSLTKIISVYRPKKVLDALYDKDPNILLYLKEFLTDTIEKHKDAIPKQIENDAMSQLISIIDRYSYNVDINWLYNPTFERFELFLMENDIHKFEIIIDKEGSGETIKAASSIFENVREEDSKSTPLIRVADMLCGLVGGFINAIHKDVIFKDTDNPNKIKTLNQNWFKLTGEQFKCYKKFKQVLIDLNNTYNKICSSRYQDCLLYLISLLMFINSYPNTNKLLADINKCPTELNSYVIYNMKDEFREQNEEWLKRTKTRRN